jgi:hypothetical protein
MGRRKVSFFNRKRKDKEEYEIIQQDVPLSTIARWFLYDAEVTDDVNELAEMVGLTRVSEDGDAKEQEESEQRLERIEPLEEYLATIADASARTLSTVHVTGLVNHGLLDEDEESVESSMESAYQVYLDIAMTTLVGAFSIGLELGIINSDAVQSNRLEGDELEDE